MMLKKTGEGDIRDRGEQYVFVPGQKQNSRSSIAWRLELTGSPPYLYFVQTWQGNCSLGSIDLQYIHQIQGKHARTGKRELYFRKRENKVLWAAASPLV